MKQSTKDVLSEAVGLFAGLIVFGVLVLMLVVLG